MEDTRAPPPRSLERVHSRRRQIIPTKPIQKVSISRSTSVTTVESKSTVVEDDVKKAEEIPVATKVTTPTPPAAIKVSETTVPKSPSEVFKTATTNQSIPATTTTSIAPSPTATSRPNLQHSPSFANRNNTNTTTPTFHPVHALLLRLYDSRVTNEELDKLITTYYHQDCTFDDPIVRTVGLEDFRTQFHSLRQFFQSHRVAVHHGFFVSHDGCDVVLDVTVEYKLRLGLNLRVRQVSRLVLSPQDGGKIMRHEDVWSMESMLSGLPLLGRMYDCGRGLFGVMLSRALRWFQPKYVPIQNEQTSGGGGGDGDGDGDDDEKKKSQ